MSDNRYAVIVAGGKGLRMESSLPKQFIEIRGIPVLMHTVNAFFNYSPDVKIILVLPETQILFWKELVRKHQYNIPHQIVKGGSTRFQSVRNGLSVIDDPEGVVAIHDGVRPLVSQEVIGNTYEAARTYGGAIAVVPVKDSLRQVTEAGTRHVNREEYRQVQTPQAFIVAYIRAAYQEKEDPLFTDDASVYEYSGRSVHLVQGEYTNLKITTPEDLILADHYLSRDR